MNMNARSLSDNAKTIGWIARNVLRHMIFGYQY